MRNRGKCKSCGDIIESFHRYDYVECKCGKIAVDGGNDYFGVIAHDFSDFIRLDDEDNEIIPKIIEKDQENPTLSDTSLNMPINRLKFLIDNIKNLPLQGQQSFITNYDMQCVLEVVYELFTNI